MKTIKVVSKNKEINIDYSIFPAGEEYIKINDDFEKITDQVDVIILSADSSTLMKACLIADALKQYDVKLTVIAILDYLPYGRQDRVCSKGESFSLKFISDMLKLRFDYVKSHDVHSNITNNVFGTNLVVPEKLYNSYNYINLTSNSTIDNIVNELLHIPNAIVVSPDKGAYERSNLLSKLIQKPLIVLDKKRTLDGIRLNISDEYKINTDKWTYDTYIVSDDICDGGGTFFALSKFIKSKNKDAQIILIFSHGIFSKGLTELKKEFNTIYVVNDEYNRFQLNELEL